MPGDSIPARAGGGTCSPTAEGLVAASGAGRYVYYLSFFGNHVLYRIQTRRRANGGGVVVSAYCRRALISQFPVRYERSRLRAGITNEPASRAASAFPRGVRRELPRSRGHSARALRRRRRHRAERQASPENAPSGRPALLHGRPAATCYEIDPRRPASRKSGLSGGFIRRLKTYAAVSLRHG